MVSLPTDIIHQPQDTASICQRLLAMLPPRSPFRLVKHCRSQVQRLMAQSEALTGDSAKLGRNFSNTRAKSFKTGLQKLF
eukprot:scaffold340966_cov25-Prasinocladus_malaysianus.AAC.1